MKKVPKSKQKRVEPIAVTWNYTNIVKRDTSFNTVKRDNLD